MNVRPSATVHTALASVTHAPSHIELVGDMSKATGDVGSRTATPTALPVSSLTDAPMVTADADIDAPVVQVPAISAMPVMGVVADAETAKPMHVRLNARAIDAHKPRRDQRATASATGGTRER